MPLKPDASDWTIKEQIIEDPVTGLTFQFEVPPNGEPHLYVFGDLLEYGNRSFVFETDGRLAGAGTHVSGLCRPAWLTELEEADDE